jgi:3-phenylpropionate/trans-cinnamate dioxygenase ferredoxin reductase subunit
LRVPVNLFSLSSLAGANELRAGARMLMSSIGILTCILAARATGLAEEGGIPLDDLSRTADLYILAASDCTLKHHALYGLQLGLESVPTR